MLPYFSIKIAWLSGSTVGTGGSEVAKSSLFFGLNALTLGMDAVALLTAFTLTYRWGLRVPAWLVVFPMWVASGFLGLIALGAPPAFLATALTGSHLSGGSSELVHPWVYGFVYAGFTGQGVGLAIAFVLHLRSRWPELFTVRVSGLARGVSGGTVKVLVTGVCGLAMLTAAVHLYWAGGGTAGVPPQAVAGRTLAGCVMEAAHGLLELVGVAGVLTLARRRSTGRLAVPLAAAWLGTGCMFSWSLWGAIGEAFSPIQNAAQQTVTPLSLLTIHFQSLAGALLATAALFLLLEGWSAIRTRPGQ
ncbi:hypothetical protein [Streptacidiphilus sp. MAP12-20]|uniref:hypothetical protein n=1 Tax=Streptacidiphilus sp. MAP12-20 TaxID=3156299 RepID=UPI0035183EDA